MQTSLERNGLQPCQQRLETRGWREREGERESEPSTSSRSCERATIRRTDAECGRTIANAAHATPHCDRGSTRRPNVASFLPPSQPRFPVSFSTSGARERNDVRYAILLLLSSVVVFTPGAASETVGSPMSWGDFVISGRGRNCHCDCGFC